MTTDTMKKVKSPMNIAPITQHTLAKILDNDTYFVKYKIIKNINASVMSNNGCTARMTPALVATALPPLNFKKIGNTWPITAQIPMNILGISTLNHNGKKTTMKPLNMSKNITRNPAFFPNTLNVFVAPKLPLPNCRISFL